MPAKPPPPRPTGLPVQSRLARLARHWLKTGQPSLWDWLTGFAAWLAREPIQTVRVLVIDTEQACVLLLKSRECRAAYCPVQGLREIAGISRHGLVYKHADPGRDAQRELVEEAILKPIDPDRFRWIANQRLGHFSQFRCAVYAVDACQQTAELVKPTAEGEPTWLPMAEAATELERIGVPKTLLDKAVASLSSTTT